MASEISTESTQPASRRDVARLCGVSEATVSLVLNNKGSISQATRERVLEQAKRLRYRPSRIAAGLSGSRTNVIGLIVPWNAPEFLDTAERMARRAGFRIMLHFTPYPDEDAEEDALQAVLDWRADGVVWMPLDVSGEYTEFIQEATRRRMKVALLDRGLEKFPEANRVVLDHWGGIRQAVDHLMEQAYTHVVYLLGSGARNQAGKQRVGMFREYAGQVGLDYQVCELPSRDPQGWTDAMVGELPARTAVFSDSNWPSLYALLAAEHSGRAVPGEIGVLSYGDLLLGEQFRVGELTRPTLTAMQRPAIKMTRLAMEAVINQINDPSDDVPVRVTLPMILHARGSTGPAGAG